MQRQTRVTIQCMKTSGSESSVEKEVDIIAGLSEETREIPNKQTSIIRKRKTKATQSQQKIGNNTNWSRTE